MQARATLQRSVEHQVAALKLLKQVHIRDSADGNSRTHLRRAHGAGSEKAKYLEVCFGSSTWANHMCGRSDFKSDLDLTTNVPTMRTVPTIAERARESIFLRLTEVANEVISVEEELCRSAAGDQRLLFHPKDSVELRNICARMSAGGACSLSERDLKELNHCLRRIVDSLLSSFTHNGLEVFQGTKRLKEIIFPDF